MVRYVVLFERWTRVGDRYAFSGTFAMLIDAEGESESEAVFVSEHHLPRGDDAFLLDGRAAWITGNREAPSLYLHLVDEHLNYERITIE
jgi:hypothetical protein